LRDGDRQLGDQVVVLAPEALVRCHPQVHVQVAGTTAARTHRAATREPQRGARVDTGGHVDLVGLLGDHPAIARARRARGDDDLTEATALRAGRGRDHLPEHALAHALHLPSTVALAARDGLGALAGAGAAAVVAAQGRAQRDGHGGTEHRLLERDVGHHFQVLPPRRAGRPAVAATERAATATEEGVEQVAQAATAEPVAGVCAADALLAEPVVAGTCLRVA